MLQLVTYLVYLILISKGLPHTSLFVPCIHLYGRNLYPFFSSSNVYDTSYELFNWRIVCRSGTMFIQSTSIFVTTQHEHAYKHWENGKITLYLHLCHVRCSSLVHLTNSIFFLVFLFASFLPNDHQYKRNERKEKKTSSVACALSIIFNTWFWLFPMFIIWFLGCTQNMWLFC